MKKFYLALAAAAALTTASNAGVTLLDTPFSGAGRTLAQSVKPGTNFNIGPAAQNRAVRANAAENDDNSLDFRLAYQPDAVLSFSKVKAGTIIYQAIEFTAENCEKFDGMELTSINVYSGQYGNTQQNRIKNVVVFLADDIDKDPFYTQPAVISDVALQQNKIELETPYTITKGKPFVIGYQLKHGQATDYYIVTDDIATDKPEGGYVGFKDGNKGVTWDNIAQYYGNLCIGATIKGEGLPKDGAAVYTIEAPSYVAPGEQFSITAYVEGAATNKAENITIEYSVGSQPATTETKQLNTPLGYKDLAGFKIPGLVCNESGVDLPVTLKITKVNGNDNSSPNNTGGSSLMCFDAESGFVRTHVIEEGTGTWCGFCPAGIVLMEFLRDTYPDDFIRIALHSGYDDEMQTSSTSSVVNLFTGFPQMLLDRESLLSPGDFDKSKKALINTAENKTPAIVTVDDISVTAINSKSINIDASVKFAFDMKNDNRYRMAYYLSEDGVGPYDQANYYANGVRGPMGGWESKGESVSTIYDDVARLLLGAKTGFSGSLPTEVKGGESYTHSQAASTTTIKSDTYYVTALVVDNNTGVIANAKQVKVDPSAVECVEAIDDNAAPARWFTLQGMEVSAPEGNGVFIKVTGNKAVKVVR